MTDAGAARARRPGGGGDGDLPLRPPEPPRDPLEFLSRSWSVSSSAADDVSRALAPALASGAAIAEDVAGELDAASGSSFSFASAATSQLVLDRIMAPTSVEVAPLTSGRLSHSSGPLNCGGSLSDSPPVSPEIDDTKFCRAVSLSTPKPQPYARGGSKTVGRWLKDRRERRKEEARAHNAQVHAAVSVAAVAAAIAAVAAGKGARTDMAVASAATLVAAQCVEAAEALGAEREQLAAAVASAVSVRTPSDVATVTAAAATALRGAATLRARALKEAWNVAAVTPVEKGAMTGGGGHHLHGGGYKHDGQQQRQRLLREVESSNSSSSCLSDELVLGEENNFLGICTQELLARGTELLKRTRKGSLHWKVVSVYINRAGLVMLKMKSRHVGGTITKKKKSVVVDVCRDVAAWPGRHLLDSGEHRRYFGLRTAEQRVIEFECGSQREHEVWTKGVARLLADARKR
ncbi:VAN3-binding protein [Zea mays]|uniref:VAN3-binding protein n=1 Tax=Zea mays TaxID=4577 RepID=A0A1D6KDG9_MAIZE|nr:VAN3-binding protein [Zea mays]ONM01277.1 VAN3-binding protein [Zea mays]|eukprot:XP_008660547.1 VAN3-binding protein [Zea mays]